MIQGIGAALSALSAGQQRMDALANDTANVNTTGYRANGRDSVQGPIYETGMPLDLAIEGDGAFQLDASAQIVTSSGASLLPPIHLPPGTDATAVKITPDGSVMVGGAQVGQIQLVGRGVLHQGALEDSNVDLASTAVDQITTRTSYSAAVEALHVQDEMWASLMELRP